MRNTKHNISYLFGMVHYLRFEMLRISILTIGDELLIGQVANTNTQWIASKLTELGCAIVAQSTIGDEREVMLSELERLLSISDMIITTGGLGPTHDDITKPVLCEYFEDELAPVEDILEDLRVRLANRGVTFIDRNQHQAWLPRKCKPLRNSVGTAPGMLFEKEGKFIISLPGVPNEMKHLVERHVLPFAEEILRKTNSSVAAFRTLQTTGCPESMLAETIGEPETFLGGATLAFLPSYQGVKLRIGVDAENIDKARTEINRIADYIYSRAGRFIFGEGESTLASAVGEELIKTGKTLSTAESCTAGMLAAAVTDVAGSSKYFWGSIIAYHNNIKISKLGVAPTTLSAHGAVSEQTALEMAINCRKEIGTDFAVSITGIAGPDGGTADKPVGTVWIGIAGPNGAYAKMYSFGNERKINRERAVGAALAELLKAIKNN